MPPTDESVELNKDDTQAVADHGAASFMKVDADADGNPRDDLISPRSGEAANVLFSLNVADGSRAPTDGVAGNASKDIGNIDDNLRGQPDVEGICKPNNGIRSTISPRQVLLDIPSSKKQVNDATKTIHPTDKPVETSSCGDKCAKEADYVDAPASDEVVSAAHGAGNESIVPPRKSGAPSPMKYAPSRHVVHKVVQGFDNATYVPASLLFPPTSPVEIVDGKGAHGDGSEPAVPPRNISIPSRMNSAPSRPLQKVVQGFENATYVPTSSLFDSTPPEKGIEGENTKETASAGENQSMCPRSPMDKSGCDIGVSRGAAKQPSVKKSPVRGAIGILSINQANTVPYEPFAALQKRHPISYTPPFILELDRDEPIDAPPISFAHHVDTEILTALPVTGGRNAVHFAEPIIQGNMCFVKFCF